MCVVFHGLAYLDFYMPLLLRWASLSLGSGNFLLIALKTFSMPFAWCYSPSMTIINRFDLFTVSQNSCICSLYFMYIYCCFQLNVPIPISCLQVLMFPLPVNHSISEVVL